LAVAGEDGQGGSGTEVQATSAASSGAAMAVRALPGNRRMCGVGGEGLSEALGGVVVRMGWSVIFMASGWLRPVAKAAVRHITRLAAQAVSVATLWRAFLRQFRDAPL
jgi:hypothetical protein